MSKKETIYIIGGGIIGCTTAYYLTKHPKFDKTKTQIIILESNDIACAASGKAGGLLASWAFPTKLGELSFRLHQSLAIEYQGDINWDYRHLPTITLDADLTTGKDNNEVSYDMNLPPNLNWIDPKYVTNWTKLSEKDSTAQVHPYKFTKFILQKAMESHCITLIYGKVINININDETEHLQSFEYIPIMKTTHNKSLVSSSTPNEVNLTLEDKIILCTGPWAPKLLPQCPISGMKAHSITIESKDHMGGNCNIEPYALFNEIKLNDVDLYTPEIYARKHDIYVCGEGDNMTELPDPMKDVEVNPGECDKLYKYASMLSPIQIGQGQIIRRQACFLPVLNVATCSGPLIGETDINNLFMASGHSCWGINNSCATGKLISELVFDGEATSCNIDNLNPQLYFQVSC
ncbi:hypothetical protein C6P44_001528 [Monosporozyma unispora]|nr:hypothetical protein C6P44_001528 [Kazachstania unispora]